jgi:hypothetical protein
MVNARIGLVRILVNTRRFKNHGQKIHVIQAIIPPTNLQQLRSFVGMINHQEEMWPHRPHIMVPLTSLTGHKLQWNINCKKSFNDMKSLITHKEVLLTYPDHNLPFKIQTDMSDYQIGSVIKQEGKPLAYL